MAVTITAVRAGARYGVWDVAATADADVAAVIPHGFGVAPEDIALTPLQVASYTSAPFVGVVDGTNINLVLSNAAGSGAVGNQLRVVARLRPDELR